MRALASVATRSMRSGVVGMNLNRGIVRSPLLRLANTPSKRMLAAIELSTTKRALSLCKINLLIGSYDLSVTDDCVHCGTRTSFVAGWNS